MFPTKRRKKKKTPTKKARRRDEAEAPVEDGQPRTNGEGRRLRRATTEQGERPTARTVTSREVRLWLTEQLQRDVADMKDDQLVIHYIAARTLRNFVPARGPAAKRLTDAASRLRAEVQKRAIEGTLAQNFADAINALDGVTPPQAQEVPAGSEQEPPAPEPAAEVIDAEAKEPDKPKPSDETTVVKDAPKDDDG